MSSAENGKPAGRLVWVSDEETIERLGAVAFARLVTRRRLAAPADPAEAIGTALIECEYRSPGMGGDPEPLHDLYMPPGAAIVRRNAVLQALGVPSPQPTRSDNP